jgi:transcriptional regulator with XRE-family HTH domain
MTGINFTLISKIENGHRSPIQGQIELFSKAYGIDEDELLAIQGIVPEDVKDVLKEHGGEVFKFLRKRYL